MTGNELDGRVVLVTGASSGLGAVLAVGLARAGARVALVARRSDQLHATAEQVRALGGVARCVVADVAVPGDVERAVATVYEHFGQLDVLVNNAGVATAVPASRETPDQFRRVLEVNLAGSYWMAQAAGARMTSGGSIINVSSVLATRGGGLPQAAYVSSKAAVIALTRDLAAQWSGRRGIRVNALVPGFFPSEMTAQYSPGYLDAMRARIPMGRLGDPEELVGPVLFLAGPGSSYVSGTTLVVDGGFLAS